MIPINIKTNRKKGTFFILLFILSIIPAIIFASISVSPTIFELQIPKGQFFTEAIRVINMGKTEIMVKAYLSDFDFQDNGNIQFPEAGTTKYSLNDYIRLNPTSLQLDPGEEKFVRFTISMPENLMGEYQGILFFQTMPKGVKSPAAGKQVLVSTRIGTAIYSAVKHTVNKSSEISGIFFKQTQSSDNPSFHYALIYHNNGNIHLRPTGQLKIIDAAGKEIASVPINKNNTSVLRESYRIYEGDFESKSDFPDGNYKIAVQIDYGKEILEAEKPVVLLNSSGIETFTAKLIPSPPGKDNSTFNAAKVLFSAVTKGIDPVKEKDIRKRVFRIKSSTGELQGELLAVQRQQNQKTQTVEYEGEWTGQLIPGLYIAEFLVSLRENEILTSFCLIDTRAAGK